MLCDPLKKIDGSVSVDGKISLNVINDVANNNAKQSATLIGLDCRLSASLESFFLSVLYISSVCILLKGASVVTGFSHGRGKTDRWLWLALVGWPLALGKVRASSRPRSP